MPNKKPVVLHYHIFKNAGTTVEWALKRNFGNASVSIEDLNDPGTIVDSKTILSFLEHKPNTKAISSHQIRFPVPMSSAYKFIPMIFIRHPIDRAISVYYFKRTMSDDSEGTQKAKKLDLNSFFEWAISNNYMVISNYQTGFLSNSPSKPKITDCKKALRSFTILGIVDLMDESLTLAEEILKNNFQNIDLSHVKQNITRKSTNLEKNLSEAKKLLGTNLFKKLEDINRHDLELYEYASNELNRRIHTVADFDICLKDYQRRCKHLTTANVKMKFTRVLHNKSKFGKYDVM